ncbi:hypothetical protein Y888_07360 [Mixta calida B021323]|nr:hypothetical protein Y888_07360 [Mixta calida B021323]
MNYVNKMLTDAGLVKSVARVEVVSNQPSVAYSITNGDTGDASVEIRKVVKACN